MENSFFFIVNARIGENKIAQLKKFVAAHLSEKVYEIHTTQYAGHANELAKEATAKHNTMVVAVGGDGTVNEVIQALANTEIPLGIIPMGSGNGLARHCQIPLDMQEAVKLLNNGKQVRIDVGKANAQYFISNAGVGFDAAVCNAIKQTTKRGLSMYIRETFRHYYSYKPDTYIINADEKIYEQKAYFLNVANGKEFGYGFEIAPNASLQDGYLDMILVKDINFWNGFSFVWDGWRKKLAQNKNCIYIRAKKISLKGKQLKYFQTDGDAHDANGECLIEIQEKALKIFVPQHIQVL